MVQANVSGHDLVGYVDEAKAVAAQVTVPPGYRVTWGGQFENQQRAAARRSGGADGAGGHLPGAVQSWQRA